MGWTTIDSNTKRSRRTSIIKILDYQTGLDWIKKFIKNVDNDFWECKQAAFIANAISLIRRNQAVSYATDRSIIFAVLTKEIYNNLNVVKVYTFWSEAKGIAAIKEIIKLYNKIIDWAEINKCSYVMAHSSPEDKNNIVARTLEKEGWHRLGNMVKYKIK